MVMYVSQKITRNTYYYCRFIGSIRIVVILTLYSV